MKSKRFIGIGIIFTVLAVLLVSGSVIRAQDPTAEPNPSYIGDPAYPAPVIPTGVDWLNVAAPLTLDQLKGKVVLLDFWSDVPNVRNMRQMRRKRQIWQVGSVLSSP